MWQVQKENYKFISFEKKPRRYSHYIKTRMTELRKAAQDNDWIDIYTGKPFSNENRPSIEHIIPYSRQGEEGLNELDNLMVVGYLGNEYRSNKAIKEVIEEEPVILERILIEFRKYEQYFSPLIDGGKWVAGLCNTLSKELGFKVSIH